MRNNDYCAPNFYLLCVVHYKFTFQCFRDQQELALLKLGALSLVPGPLPRRTLALRAAGFAPKDPAGGLVPSRDLDETLRVFLKPPPLSRR